MESQLQAMQLLLQFFNNEYANHGRRQQKGKERQDSSEKRNNIMVFNK